jgi:hypothetical protein
VNKVAEESEPSRSNFAGKPIQWWRILRPDSINAVRCVARFPWLEYWRWKGTVTPLESQFSPEEVQNATKHVQDAIAAKNNELHQLRAFIDDNNNLVSLVQKLPEQLSHDIMIPFGKAAFFPGR